MTDSGTLGLGFEESRIALKLIGAAMRDATMMRELMALGICDDDFASEPLRILWQSSLSIYKAAGRVDASLVASSMETRGIPKADAEWIVQSARHGSGFDDGDDIESIYAHVERMRRKVASRNLAGLGNKILERARYDDADPLLIGSHARAELDRVLSLSVSMRAADGPELSRISSDILSSTSSTIRTVPLGIPIIDDALGGGAQVGRMTIVIAGSGVGKTTIARHMLISAASAGIGCVYWCPESDRTEMARGLAEVIAGTRIPINPAALGRHEAAKLAEASAVLRDLPVLIEDDSELTVEDLIARFQTYRRRCGIAACFVDYVQDVARSIDFVGGAFEKHEHTSLRLRNAARMRGEEIAIIGFSQTASLDKKDKRKLSVEDTGGTKRFGKDAAAIITMERDRDSKDDNKRDVSCVRLVKNRLFGSLAEAWMQYDRKTTRLSPCSPNGEGPSTMTAANAFGAGDDDEADSFLVSPF